jgi:hypothetical protein
MNCSVRYRTDCAAPSGGCAVPRRGLRLPLGLLFIAASSLWFLPVVGIELLPLGLLLIAIDVPFLQGPVGRATLWLEHRWLRLKARWKSRRRSHSAQARDSR